MKKQTLEPQALGAVADMFKALSEPSRLKILQELQSGEKSVSELALALGSSQPNVSKHLKLLAEAGVVQRRQVGNTVYYFIEDSLVYELCNLVCGSIQKRLHKKLQIFTAQPRQVQKTQRKKLAS